ncbi:MAG: L,D-transpeptidase [Deltaproteobacteria bacterium]|nr:L,D-transpeptidase [Deltaproteobacteria bacterium]
MAEDRTQSARPATGDARRRVLVSLSEQRLRLLDGSELIAEYPVSTAANGAGELEGSHKTPRGRHAICEKIGEDAPRGAVFVGRRATGELCTAAAWAAAPERDWMLTRILWLDGLEEGVNRGGAVDSRRRYIYIHGTPDQEPMGVARSHGCVRMRNDDVLALFDLVAVGTEVEIVE